MNRLLMRVFAVFRGRSIDRELDEELAVAENRRNGMSPEDARRAADPLTATAKGALIAALSEM